MNPRDRLVMGDTITARERSETREGDLEESRVNLSFEELLVRENPRERMSHLLRQQYDGCYLIPFHLHLC